MTTTSHIADTSRGALAKISPRGRMTASSQIEAIVANACRAGAKGLSMQEIQEPLEQALGRRVDMSTISARVNELVSAKRLLRDIANPRVCSKSGAMIHPLSVAPKQVRAFY